MTTEAKVGMFVIASALVLASATYFVQNAQTVQQEYLGQAEDDRGHAERRDAGKHPYPRMPMELPASEHNRHEGGADRGRCA